MKRDVIRQVIKEHGVNGFLSVLDDLLVGRTLPNGKVQKIDPHRISITALFEAMVGPVDSSRPLVQMLQEAGDLVPSAFPTATEKLISTVTIAAYTARRQVADTLVPAPYYSPKTITERIPGFTSMSTSKSIMPGEPYPTGDIADKFTTFEEAIHNKKEGLELAVTEEAIRFDQTGMIMRNAENVGASLQIERERRTVRAVLGIGKDSGTALNGVYFPSGADTALYLAANNNLRTNTTPIFNHPGKTADSKLEDYTDIHEVLTVHAQNIKDDRQLQNTRPIAWSPDAILVPVALAGNLGNILQSTTMRFTSTDSTAGTNPAIQSLNNNPLPSIFSAFGAGALPTPVASVYADEVSATAWVMFDKRTFVRVEIFPFQVFRSMPGYGWNRDIVVSFRVREWSRVIATDNKLAVYSSGAS